jgi:protein-S-isoprenylcysteine O-methyltransferase Ste14
MTLMKNLRARAWFSLFVLAVVMGLLLFVPAGTVRYWLGWIYLSIFFGAAALTTWYLMRHDPALLERRMKGGPTAETRPAEKAIMLAASAGFIGLLVVSALDHRHSWSVVPLGGVVAGDVLVAIGFYFIFLVYRENTFTSATIEIAADQRVISTGPYAIVRHPMYASGMLYILGTPLALGSYWGLVPLAVMLPFLIWRLFDEERLLSEQLAGYTDYQQKVRHRLLPGVW